MRRTAGCFSTRSTSTSRRSRSFPDLKQRACKTRPRRCATPSWSTTRRSPRLKLAGLRARLRALPRRDREPARRADFEAYRAEQGEALLRFACFEVLRRATCAKPWPEWPRAVARAATRGTAEYRKRNISPTCEFHEFMQWTADRQLAACQAARDARHADRPLHRPRGRHRSGTAPTPGASRTPCCARCRSARRRTNSTRRGQDWGLAPFNPHSARRGRFRADARSCCASTHAARRRGPARSCARPQAHLHDSARAWRGGRRLCALSVRAVAARHRRGERAAIAAS